MLTAITRAFRTPDLRKKLLFTLGIIALFRLGSVLPTPGVNAGNVRLAEAASRSARSSSRSSWSFLLRPARLWVMVSP